MKEGSMTAVSDLIEHIQEECDRSPTLLITSSELAKLLTLLDGVHSALVHAGVPTRDVKTPGIHDALETADERAATLLAAFIKDRTDDVKAS